MSDLKVKPCPFCGNKKLTLAELPGFLVGRYFVHCPKCHTSGPLNKKRKPPEESGQDACKRWNKRHKEE